MDKRIRHLSDEDKEGLGVALNEATLLGAEIHEASRIAGVTLSVLTLPEAGPAPADPRLQILCFNVGRVAASLRLGVWNDASAPVVTFGPGDLLTKVQEFGGCAVYGWEFFDVADARMATWHSQASFDVRYSSTDGQRHSLTLFQEGSNRHLGFCIWFDEMVLRDSSGNDLDLADVIAGGKRWWDAFHDNDPRTRGNGMIPLA
jgi:hypothetical protein